MNCLNDHGENKIIIFLLSNLVGNSIKNLTLSFLEYNQYSPARLKILHFGIYLGTFA